MRRRSTVSRMEQSAETGGEDADIIYFDFSFAYYDVIDGGATQDEIVQKITMDYEIKRRT